MTDTLSRINTVLASWDAQPRVDDGWLPGDPLYAHPHGVIGGQVVRPMFQILDDDGWMARCVECDVDWRGPAACFVCGVKRDERRGPSIMYGGLELGSLERAPSMDAVSTAAMGRTAAAAMASFEEQMIHVRQLMDDDIERRLERWLPNPARRMCEPDELPDPADRPSYAFTVIPDIANPSAPTVAELEAAADVTSFIQPPSTGAPR